MIAGSGSRLAVLAESPATDLGNAERFALEHLGTLRYCDEQAAWYVWDGQRWDRDTTRAVDRCTAATARGLYDQAPTLSDATARKTLASWAVKSEAAPRLQAIRDLARSQQGLSVRVRDLDQHPDLLVTRSGTVDLRDGSCRPSRRSDLLTHLAPVAYDPEATAPRWSTFLTETFGDDDGLLRYVQRAAGYSATGHASEQVLFLADGTPDGRNGKTTFLETLRTILGDYAQTVPTSVLCLERHDGAREDLARLAGIRLGITLETADGRHLDAEAVKQLTGGDTLTARPLYGHLRDFAPTAHLWLASNYRPQIRDAGNSLWRRLRLIPFHREVAPTRTDPDLKTRLLAEAPGILAWIVQGAIAWTSRRLDPPEGPCRDQADYRAESDSLARFLADHSEPATCSVAFSDLYAQYRQWSKAAGESPLSRQAAGRQLASLGYPKLTEGHRNQVRYQGLRLLYQERITDENG